MKKFDFSPVINVIQPDDLPKPYNDIARRIGIENTLILAEYMSGVYQYFPKYSKAIKELVRRLAFNDYNRGMDFKEIARKYEKSETWVRKLVKDSTCMKGETNHVSK